ncbi:opioid-binding protein/cell adhesion molecule-like isoform X5 [Acropora palmata]|uniref:opioid-binding protein/cell adhesion molecule-like isoform X5 n=1 Tax=Acropora palmata TaxID=6131 RepID=UPI003DA0338F
MTIITDHFSKRPVTLNEGNTNATIRWHFVLVYLTFHSLTISFEGQVIAGIKSSKQGPEPGFENQFGINWIVSQNLVTLTIFNSTTDVNGVFTCEVSTERGFGTFQFSSSVEVNIVAPPSNIVTPSDQNVKPPAELTLNCSANGKPKPTVTWTRVSDNSVVPIKPKLLITGGKDAGTYRCTADNGVGNPLHKDVKVNVLLPPKVTLPKRVLVGREQTATLICEVEGNPKPNISWSGCDQPNHLCDKQYLSVLKVQNPCTNYTCTGRNYLGSDSATTVLIIGGNRAYIRLSTCGECEDKDSIWETLENKLSEVFANTQSYIGAKEIHVSSRSGSLIFDVVLNFKSVVTDGSTWLIIGVVLGSVALVALIVFIYCVCKKMLWTGTKDSNQFVTAVVQ